MTRNENSSLQMSCWKKKPRIKNYSYWHSLPNNPPHIIINFSSRSDAVKRNHQNKPLTTSRRVSSFKEVTSGDCQN